MSLSIILVISHLIICFLVLFFSLKLLFSKKHSLLSLILSMFVLADSLGVIIGPYFPMDAVKYLSHPGLFKYAGGFVPVPVLNQIFSHWIFLSISLLALFFEMSWFKRKTINYRKYNNKKIISFSFVLFIIGVIGYLRYFILGPGLQILLSTKLAFSSASEAVQSRSIGFKTGGLGQGDFLASISANILFPVAAVLFLRSKQKGKWFIYFFISLFSFAYAFQTRQKAPLLFWFLTYFLIYTIEKSFNREYSNEKIRLRKIFINLILLSFVGETMLYVINFGQDIKGAIVATFARIFVIPAVVEHFFFVAFPRIFNYRGLSQIFYISLGKIPIMNTITIYNVAKAITGDSFSANASFIAVAWSAGGYVGILLISVFFIVIHLFIDFFIQGLQKKEYYQVIALGLYSSTALISGSFSDYFFKGGIIIPLLFVLIYRLSLKYEKGAS